MKEEQFNYSNFHYDKTYTLKGAKDYNYLKRKKIRCKEYQRRETLNCRISKKSKKQKNVLCLVTQLCPTLQTPWTSGHQAPLPMGILQARILEWVAMASSRGSSQLRAQTQVSCIAGEFFTSEPPGKNKNTGFPGDLLQGIFLN